MSTSKHSLRTSSVYLVLGLLSGLFIAMDAPLPANAAINYIDSTCDLTQVNGVYEISTAEQLWEIAGCSAESAVFSLSGSIDVSGSTAPTTSPIGWGGACDNEVVAQNFIDGRKRFRGTFEGNGHTISNFAISVNSSCPAGLFAVLKNATIRNLNLVGTAENIRSSGAYDGAAGLAGTALGDVTLSHVVGNVVISARKGSTGGFVGNNLGRESAGSGPGGSLPLRLHIEASQNSGEIIMAGSAAANGFGGFVGLIEPTNPATSVVINQSQNTGPISFVSGEKYYVGGFVGSIDGNLQIHDSENLAAMSGKWHVGGLVGESLGVTTISASINSGLISVSSLITHVGGLVGGHKNGGSLDIISSQNTGDIPRARYYVGGLIGYLESARSLISSSGNAGVITAEQRVGGLIGYAAYTNGQLTLSGSSNSGQVSATGVTAFGDSQFLGSGGLIGYFGNGLLEVYGSSNHASVSGFKPVGGLVAQSRNSQVTISNSSNFFAISGSENVGGLVGTVDGGTLSIIDSSNLGSVEASHPSQGSAGGMLGGQFGANLLLIERSFNIGDVSGFRAGGLFGFLDGSSSSYRYNLVDVYNAGRMTGALASGFGFDGGGSQAHQLHRGYSAGRFGSTPSDGLIAGYPTYTVVSSSFTTTDSTLVSASTEAELKVITTFVGWDFTVWGFGPCTLNDGFPVLRWAHPGETFYSYSCGENSQPVQNNQVPGSSVAPPPTAPVYMGPILDGGMISVSRLEQVEIAGSRLLSIVAAEIDGFVVEILSLSSSSMVIKIPTSVSDGVHDLVVLSSYGTLTVQRKLQIIQPLAPESFGELLGYRFSLKFQGNSRSLSGLQEAGVDRSLGEFSEATTIVCWGYTTSVDPRDWAIAHATARANSVCAQAQTVRGDVKYYVRVRFGVPKDAAMRASMQFWTSEKSN